MTLSRSSRLETGGGVVLVGSAGIGHRRKVRSDKGVKRGPRGSKAGSETVSKVKKTLEFDEEGNIM